MRKGMLVAGLAVAALATTGDLLACGDKLVVVGRGRPRRTRGVHSAAILLFADPNGALPAALEEGKMRQDLERAGHRLRSVTTRQELDAALGTGTYDLLMTDYRSAQELEKDAMAAPSRPTVLPTLYKPSASDLAAAESYFRCVLKAPSQQRDYLAVVDQALAERSKQNPSGRSK